MILYKHPTYKIITSLFKRYSQNHISNIVDSGCGNGYLLDLLGVSQVKNYLGYDVSNNAIKEAINKYGKYQNFKFVKIKPNRILPSPSSKVDAIFSIGVLQYLSDREIVNFFEYSKKNLKKKGKVYVSCTTDHKLYKILNIYNLFLPSHTNNRSKLISIINKKGLRVKYQKESGLFLGPLFWHNIVVFFDALDKIVFRNKGKLGFFGNSSRIIATFLLSFEHFMPFDYGYTLYMVVEKP